MKIYTDWMLIIEAQCRRLESHRFAVGKDDAFPPWVRASKRYAKKIKGKWEDVREVSVLTNNDVRWSQSMPTSSLPAETYSTYVYRVWAWCVWHAVHQRDLDSCWRNSSYMHKINFQQSTRQLGRMIFYKRGSTRLEVNQEIHCHSILLNMIDFVIRVDAVVL